MKIHSCWKLSLIGFPSIKNTEKKLEWLELGYVDFDSDKFDSKTIVFEDSKEYQLFLVMFSFFFRFD